METKPHPTYTVVKDPKDAEAEGWGFYDNSGKIEKVYFKFPSVGDDELRIKTTYAGLCHSDIHTVTEDWGPIKDRPILPGHEILGIVTHVGKNVTDWKVGDKAGFGCFRDFCGNCKNCKKGDDHFCQDQTLDRFTYGNKHWGGYGSSVQQPAKLFFRVPEGIPDEVVPPLFCAGITSYSPIKAYVKPGDKVGCIGVGGVGHMAVQMLKAWGVHVTAFTSSKDKTEELKKMGATDVIVTTEEGALEKAAGQYDVLLNFLPELSSEQFHKFFNCLATMGTWVQIGAPPAEGEGKGIPFNLTSFVMTERKLVGSLVGPKQRIIEMLDFSVKHKTYPICEVFSYEDFPKAWNRLKNERPRFRCVVRFDQNLK